MRPKRPNSRAKQAHTIACKARSYIIARMVRSYSRPHGGLLRLGIRLGFGNR